MTSTDKGTKVPAPPVFRTKVGRVQLAGFANPTSTGEVFFTYTTHRSYKTKDGSFSDAYSFTSDDGEDMKRAITEFQDFVAEQTK